QRERHTISVAELSRGRNHLRSGDIDPADAPQRLDYDPLLCFQLRVVPKVLDRTSPTMLVVGARRLPALWRGREHAEELSARPTLAGGGDGGLDLVAGRGAVYEDDPSVVHPG